jgi:hypothetical protein
VREIFIAPERPLLHAARDSSEESALNVKREGIARTRVRHQTLLFNAPEKIC